MSKVCNTSLARAGTRWRVCAAAGAFALSLLAGEARTQEPSAGAIAAAKELIELKGATQMFDPLVPGVIESAKGTFLRTNPGLSKDLNDVATQLRNEHAPKRAEAGNLMARLYAQQFSEREIKDAVAFFKTPLGKKIIDVEPRVMEESMTRIQTWADQFSDEMMSRFRAEMKKKGHNL